jgi:arylsulfatase A-like enzyme
MVEAMDLAVGQVMEKLDELGLAENTLVLFTSDNGCAPQARIHDLKAKGHDVSGGLRGNKADLYDGGVRVPFLARWPDRARPAESGQLVCLTDLFATFAELVDADVPAHAAEDSFSFASALLSRPGVPTRLVRDAVVLHSAFGSFAIREGEWKLALCAGSGGWSTPVNFDAEAAGLPMTQLYHIGGADRGERTNLQAEQPERVQRLEVRLREIVAAGRSTPGPRASRVPRSSTIDTRVGFMPGTADATRDWMAPTWLRGRRPVSRSLSTTEALGSSRSRLNTSRRGMERCTRAPETGPSDPMVRASSPSRARTRLRFWTKLVAPSALDWSKTS